MEQAIEAYRHISESDRLKEIQRMREKAWVNESYAMLNAKEQGMKEGRQEGRQEGNKYVLDLIAQGFSTEQIRQQLERG